MTTSKIGKNANRKIHKSLMISRSKKAKKRLVFKPLLKNKTTITNIFSLGIGLSLYRSRLHVDRNDKYQNITNTLPKQLYSKSKEILENN